MPPRGTGSWLQTRPRRLGLFILAGTAAGFVALLVPDLLRFLPDYGVHRWTVLVLLALGAIDVLLSYVARRRENRGRTPGAIASIVGHLDTRSDRILAGPLQIAIIAALLALWAAWLPHYLLWPWCRDPDTFATLAMSWDAGILPYRDIRGYNFPGAIYLMWALGHIFGWGRTWPLYLVDASALLLLGFILTAWSRRCLGRTLPGLAAYLVFVTFYLNLNFESVAERDWHTALLVVLALLIAQAWPGRASLGLAAVLTAMALVTRPHAVFFLPAVCSVVLEKPDGSTTPGNPRRWRAIRRLGLWLGLLLALTALAFAPLFVAGIAGDLLRGLRVTAYGGPYNRATPATAALVFIRQLAQPSIPVIVILTGVACWTARGAARRRATTWILALAAALVYRVFHPQQHAYLAHPLVLVSSVAMALPFDGILERRSWPSALRLIALLALGVEASSGLPLFCNPRASVEAIGTMARGETLTAISPPGSIAWFDPRLGRWYAWKDYCDTLRYLRRTVPPSMMVANVLKEPPFPSLNGPTGRLSPFRAESGICWMWLVKMDLEPEFVAAIEREKNTVVVWSPAEHRLLSQLNLERLAAAIRRSYVPEAVFGPIEVWRRADAPALGLGGPPEPSRDLDPAPSVTPAPGLP